MVQKPLAESAEVAQRLVTRARDLGVRLFMQMNGRWVPTFRKLRDVVHSGILGEIHVVQILNRGLNPKTPEEWRSHLDRLIGYEMAIHHVDLLVWLFGLPEWVFATYRSVPGFVVKADNFAVMTMGFGEHLVANVVEDWTCQVETALALAPEGRADSRHRHRWDGLHDPHELTITVDGGTRTYVNKAPWFPDAFGGPMEEALNARREGRASDIEGAGSRRSSECPRQPLPLCRREKRRPVDERLGEVGSALGAGGFALPDLACPREAGASLLRRQVRGEGGC